MGYALAEAAIKQGHTVTLISGPVALTVPHGVGFFSVETAQQMWDVTRDVVSQNNTDIAIMTAAVADYRPRFFQPQKVKKTDGELTLELERTPDILASMRPVFGFTGFLAGFAAETNNLIQHSMLKLKRKACDLIIANEVSSANSAFDSNENEVTLCFPDGKTNFLPMQSKLELAQVLIGKIVTLANEKWVAEN